MDYNSNLQELKDLMVFDTKFYHNLKKGVMLIPFQSRTPNRPDYQKDGFKKIIAEFSRLLFDKSWNGSLSAEYLVEKFESQIDCSEEDKQYLKAFISDYLFSGDEISLVSPYLFFYINLSDGNSKTGELDVAKFFRDVMFNDIPQIKDYFNYSGDMSDENIILRLILENLPELDNKIIDKKYYPKLDNIRDIFKEDILFALQHEEFFSKNIENIFAYYYFFYVTQLSLKLFEPFESLNKIKEIYFLVDGERATNTRETIDHGFDLIKSNNNTLNNKIVLIDYVNILLGTEGLLLAELKNEVKKLSKQDYDEFIAVFKSFLEQYFEKRKWDFGGELSNDFDGLVDTFFNCLNTRDPAINSRYLESLTGLADRYFLKNAGIHSKVLNIDQNMLLSITALCIRDDKIKLNSLFEEYNKRGLFFDKKSRIKIENILTKLDLIDKKSDSEDAQYVKRIL